MKLQFYILLLLLLVSHIGVSQKQISKEFEALGIEKISIVSDAIFKVSINTTLEKKITIAATFEGELFDKVFLNVKQHDNNLELTTSFLPDFIPINDKLAAHKLLSIELVLKIPKGFVIEIQSELASLIAIGEYKNIQASLQSGNCDLFDFSGNATIKTFEGNIHIEAQTVIYGQGISINGTVINELINPANYLILAETNKGSIVMVQKK